MTLGFPKEARLLKSREFRFRPFGKFPTPNFQIVFALQGSGRLGVSLSRKNLRSSVARNRVRRLIREAFRLHRGELARWDFHFIGQPSLAEGWSRLKRQDVEATFAAFLNGRQR